MRRSLTQRFSLWVLFGAVLFAGLAGANSPAAVTAEGDELPPGFEWRVVSLQQLPVSEPVPPAVAPPLFGADDRVQYTESIPYVARLLILGDDGDVRQCTGVFVTDIALLTTPGCLYDTSTRRPARAVKVIPGSFDKTEQYGSTLARDFSVPVGYQPSSTQPGPYDFAVIRVDPTAFGSDLRPYDPVIVYDETREWTFESMATAGHPAEKEPGSLYVASADGFTTTATAFHTFVDLTPGMEGGPLVFAGLDLVNIRLVVGLVGLMTQRGELTTSALRFSADHLAALYAWCEPRECTIAGQRGRYKAFAPGASRVGPVPSLLPPANFVHVPLNFAAVRSGILQAAKVLSAELHR